jgi:hypothetical protein
VWKVSFETAAGERVRFVRSPEVAGWRYEDLMDAVKKTLG